LLLICQRAFREACGQWPRVERLLGSPPGTALRMSCTFLAVCVGWIFFRSTTFAGAGCMLERLFVPTDGLGAPMHYSGFAGTVVLVAVCHLLARTVRWQRLALHVPVPVTGLGYAALITLTLVLAPASDKAFIYFQF
jgi:alginate O-acetyltransferase complex protein AlgI